MFQHKLIQALDEAIEVHEEADHCYLCGPVDAAEEQPAEEPIVDQFGRDPETALEEDFARDALGI